MKINKDRYYILDFRNILHIRFYNKPFRTVSQAKDVIDAYLGEGAYTVVKGSFIILRKVSAHARVHFRKYLPKQYRKGSRPANIKAKREKLRGKGIIHHMFKDIWDELPTDPDERKAYFNKGRSAIHTRILK